MKKGEALMDFGPLTMEFLELCQKDIDYLSEKYGKVYQLN